MTDGWKALVLVALYLGLEAKQPDSPIEEAAVLMGMLWCYVGFLWFCFLKGIYEFVLRKIGERDA